MHTQEKKTQNWKPEPMPVYFKSPGRCGVRSATAHATNLMLARQHSVLLLSLSLFTVFATVSTCLWTPHVHRYHIASYFAKWATKCSIANCTAKLKHTWISKEHKCQQRTTAINSAKRKCWKRKRREESIITTNSCIKNQKKKAKVQRIESKLVQKKK